MAKLLTQIEKIYDARAELDELLKDPKAPRLQLYGKNEVFTTENIEDIYKMVIKAGRIPTEIKAKKRLDSYYPYSLGFSYCTKAGTTIKFYTICSEDEAKQFEEADDET